MLIRVICLNEVLVKLATTFVDTSFRYIIVFHIMYFIYVMGLFTRSYLSLDFITLKFKRMGILPIPDERCLSLLYKLF
jgi:hypothetical protein